MAWGSGPVQLWVYYHIHYHIHYHDLSCAFTVIYYTLLPVTRSYPSYFADGIQTKRHAVRRSGFWLKETLQLDLYGSVVADGKGHVVQPAPTAALYRGLNVPFLKQGPNKQCQHGLTV